MHLCHNRAHLHGARTDAWYAGYQELLPKIAADFEKKHGRPLALMGEMVNDQNGCIVDVQLNQLFYNYHTHGFPEMYAYTFPEHGVIDMLYPEKNLAMRPVHTAQKCHALMARLFTNGSHFWVYDLVGDNTFGDARFMDEVGLQYAHEGDTFLVKRFEAEDGQNFIVVFAEHPAGTAPWPLTSLSNARLHSCPTAAARRWTAKAGSSHSRPYPSVWCCWIPEPIHDPAYDKAGFPLPSGSPALSLISVFF